MFVKRNLKRINILRLFKHTKHKIYRMKDPPESISIGLAWGAAVSFTPLLGLHIITCFLGTYFMKGNILAAAAGTIIGNPWTFPIIFYFCYNLGLLFGFEGVEYFKFDLIFFFENFEKLFFPTFIGSIPISVIVWFITYKVSKLLLLKRFDKNVKKKN